MLYRLLSALAIVAVLASVVGCGSSAPTLPSPDAAAVGTVLTGADGARLLFDISTYKWPDAGAQPAQRFEWIAADAGSADAMAATRSGRSAQVLAAFLADDYDALVKVPVGQRNPKLLRAYAAALIPYQVAMVSPAATLAGFSALDPPGGLLPRTEKVFALIDTDTEAGQAFSDAARQHARDLVARYARQVVLDKSHPATDTADLDAAASLYALADAAATESGNLGITRLGSGGVVNDADWIVTKTLLPQRPPPSPIPAKFFDPNGQLRDPRDPAINDPSEYLRYLTSYVGDFRDLAAKLHILYDQHLALNGLS